MLVEILENNIDSRLIDHAVQLLRSGEIIIIPTDTVYALVCDLKNKKAMSNMAHLKGEKLSKVHFSVMCHDLSNLSDYVKQIDRPTYKLLRQNLPGPFTFILNANHDVPRLFDSKKREIGIRIPDNKIALEIIESLGNPIACTSLHNDEDDLFDYFIDPYQIFEKYDNSPYVKMIIDGGNGKLIASTIVDCTKDEYEIIRQGEKELK
ncbi:MAG: threonylcarbamoyl-AMP synthase [Bacteroidetes bacterium]|nr:threonylcarbamoyl-AMP synthase [Bacteroidota bacterium]